MAASPSSLWRSLPDTCRRRWAAVSRRSRRMSPAGASASGAGRRRAPGTPEPRSDRLELLERLPAGVAVADRPARRRPEEVLQVRVGGAAVGAAKGIRLELH